MAKENWQTDTLANICDSIDYGLTESAKTLPVGPKFLRITDIVSGHINWNAVPYCEIAAEDKPKYQLHHGDIVIARTGATTGYSIYVQNPPDAVFASYLVRYKTKKDFDSQYVSYFLKSSDYWEYIRGVLGDKSAQPNASASTNAQVKIKYPPLPEQRAIAGILGALDDKIELNRRMNATLESMSRAVFRQWFVESEELKGWDDLKWGDIATLEYGKSLSDYKFLDAPYVVYGTNGPIGRHTEALYPSEGIIIGRKGAYRGIHYSPNPFFVIDTAFYLRPQKPFSMKWAYYELLRLDLNSMDSGSAIPSTSRPDFYNLPVIFPSQEIMSSFEAFVAPLFSKIYANEKESRTLASLRDSLLPKLMRGEVRVSAL